MSILLTRDASSSAIVIVTGIYCRDIPMQSVYQYASAARYAPDGVNGFKARDTIQNGGGTSTVSVDALSTTQMSSTSGTGVRNEARRGALFNWTDIIAPFVSTSTPGYTAVFQQPPPVLGRFLHYSSGTTRETVRTVKIYVLAFTDSGTLTATFRVTESTASATASITVNSVTPTWYSTTLDIDCDDMTRIDTVGGTRSGGRCTLTFDARVETAASVTIYAISVGEHRQL